MDALFDTNIIIDALNGIDEANVEYGRYDHIFISLITWMEVLVGAQEDDSELRDFLETNFEIAPLDPVVADTAVQLRRKHRIRLPDAIIWATAQTKDVILVTRNTKDFDPHWKGIHLPYKL